MIGGALPSIGILGANGRMGRAVAEAVAVAGARLTGGVGGQGVVFGDHESAGALATAADVLIDFSSPVTLAAHLAAATAAGTPILIGTTGLQPADHAAIDGAAAQVAVLQSANTSLGVNLLCALVAQAAARLGTEWDVEIVEMHHRHKIDAPSGTALLLGAAVAEARGSDLRAIARTDRQGVRDPGTIGFASLRGGSVAGDHSVLFAAEGETITLSHHAENRGIFATGAVRAALWLADRPAGRYTMADVLGL